ncbi:MAG: ATP-dependent helicase RecG, partial [Cyanobacteriota bacterium]
MLNGSKSSFLEAIVSLSLDWQRLQKALSVEVERGFQNLQGKQHQFSAFFCLTFGSPPPAGTPTADRRRWREFADKYAHYETLSQSQRQSLVASTRRFLHDLRCRLEAPSPAPRVMEPPPHVHVPRVADSSRRRPDQVVLTTPLRELTSLSKRQTQLLHGLGLTTVEEMLTYFPRDYLDYARQVTIDQLTAGETVTLVGQVVSCHCFTSPKNQNLTIFQIQLRDQTGRIKL